MIVCLGTTPVYQRTMIFERLMLDQVNRAQAVNDYASGKSINAARVIRTLGADVLASGFVGGPRGELLRRELDQLGIHHEFVTVAPQTRQCVTVIDQAAGSATELVEESIAVAEADWRQLEEKLREILPQAAVWVFSGTLPPQAPPDFYARWLPLAKQVGAAAIVDARGEPLRLAMRHPNPILKVNREELASTIGEDLSDDTRLFAAMRRHVPPEGKLIVTLGAAGAMACESETCWRASAPSVRTVSAVGSGDAFAGGLAVALSQRLSTEEALNVAVACGAANAMTPFAGHVHPADVQKLLGQVALSRSTIENREHV